VVLLLAMLFIHPMPQLLQVGSIAPRIHLRDTAGSTVTAVPSAAHRPVVVTFFEPSCVTCQQTASVLCTIKSRYPNVEVVMVDSGGSDAGAAAGFSRRYLGGCSVPFLLDADLTVSRGYAVSVVPLAYVVDTHGKISYGGLGAAGMDGLLPHLAHVPGG
jgi:thiol-disulfide isomerase/thioredoxin